MFRDKNSDGCFGRLDHSPTPNLERLKTQIIQQLKDQAEAVVAAARSSLVGGGVPEATATVGAVLPGSGTAQSSLKVSVRIRFRRTSS